MVLLRLPLPMAGRSAPRLTAMACAPHVTLSPDDDLVIMSSEIGVLPIPQERIVKKWRLQPGRMFLLDLEQGRIIDDEELKHTLSTAEPYRRWIAESRVFLDDLPIPRIRAVAELKESLLDTQQAFGYTREDISVILEPMITNGEEPTGSIEPIHRLCRCCRADEVRPTTISSNSSRRSPIRRSTRSVKKS